MGRWSHFEEHIFQMGWFNHQLENCLTKGYEMYGWTRLTNAWHCQEPTACTCCGNSSRGNKVVSGTVWWNYIVDPIWSMTQSQGNPNDPQPKGSHRNYKIHKRDVSIGELWCAWSIDTIPTGKCNFTQWTHYIMELVTTCQNPSSHSQAPWVWSLEVGHFAQDQKGR